MGKHVEWRAIGQSVRGASHVRSGLPNQDAIRWLPASRVGPPLILTVSDGHGSPKSFRSDIGSRLAVDETSWLIQDLLDGQPDPNNLSVIKRTAEERLLQEIVRRWQKAVDSHLAKHPFTTAELENLETKRDAKARREVETGPRLAYGATLLSVLVTGGFVLYLQLGDGDILTVSESGEVTRPLPIDARLIANETTSLCMSKPWHEIRFHFQALFGELPALILLATDGYANSFVDETAFLKVGSDILDIFREEGVATVEQNLSAWLKHASTSGSGDDITLGILYRTDIPGLSTKKPRTKSQERAAPGPAPTKSTAPPEEELHIIHVPAPEPETPPEDTPLPEQPEPTTEPAPQQEPPPEPVADSPPAPEAGKPAAAKGIERIKSEGPKEPAKKLPDIFVGN